MSVWFTKSHTNSLGSTVHKNGTLTVGANSGEVVGDAVADNVELQRGYISSGEYSSDALE